MATLLAVSLLMGLACDSSGLAIQESVKKLKLDIPDAAKLMKSAAVYYGKHNDLLALADYKVAQDSLELAGRTKEPEYAQVLLSIGGTYGRMGRLALAFLHIEKAKAVMSRSSEGNAKIKGGLHFQRASLAYARQDYSGAAVNFDRALSIFRKGKFQNSKYYLLSLINYGAALSSAGQKKLAMKSFAAAVRINYVLDRQKSLEGAMLSYNIALLKKNGTGKFRTALWCNASMLPEKSKLGLTSLEEKIVRSYTGAFRFHRSKPSIQRTYKNRQKDTNVLLADLLNLKKKDVIGLEKLRKKTNLLSSNAKGAGIMFIDIGPAVGNTTHPAPTSQSVARDFSEMSVVAFDLPYAVRIYKRNVPMREKRKLLALSNIHIFAGDGLKSLATQFKDEKGWILKDRKHPRAASSKLIVIRAANSIDIYVPWKRVKPALLAYARDFQTKPLLILFNRTILFKEANSDQYRVAGILSVRGFHHQKVSFSRWGQEPYTLNP